MLTTTGILYIIATPIGNLDDISLRAIETLKTVDLIAAEDTRHSKHLLQHFNIKTPMISLHDHNEAHRLTFIEEKLCGGLNVALISDAGTPLISDPGYKLVSYLRQKGYNFKTVPGPCALIAALSIAGLPTDKFTFEGFLPAKKLSRQHAIKALADETRTLIFYESPHRILDTVIDLKDELGETRQAALARELTKTYETVLVGTLKELEEQLLADSNQQRGEFVVLIEGKEEPKTGSTKTLSIEQEKMLKTLLTHLSIKDAVKIAVELTGLPKNFLYEQALNIKSL